MPLNDTNGITHPGSPHDFNRTSSVDSHTSETEAKNLRWRMRISPRRLSAFLWLSLSPCNLPEECAMSVPAVLLKSNPSFFGRTRGGRSFPDRRPSGHQHLDRRGR